jgi:hypothetical protein
LITACKALGDPKLGAPTLQKLWKNKLPDLVLADPAAEAARALHIEALRARDRIQASWRDSFDRARIRASEVLRARCTDERFRQAVLWQNPSAVSGALDWLARRPVEATDTKTRQNERFVANYLQRYSVKNDTIGFFGPVGWATFDPALGVAVEQVPGPTLIASRTTFFEYWAIDALAKKLAEAPDLRRGIPPRLRPMFRVEGKILTFPVDRSSVLPDDLADVAARCDGAQTVASIARELAVTEDDVIESLEALVDAGAVLWTLEISTHVSHPERALAEALARIEAEEPRRRAEASLARLSSARDAVAAARTAEALQPALLALGETFTRETDTASTRAAGKMYAGRTIVYEDCRRDLEVRVGRPVLAKLAAPLALVLASARWFTFEIARRYRALFDAEYDRMVADGGKPSFGRFSKMLGQQFGRGSQPGTIVGDVRVELQRRWAEILAGRTVVATADISDAVERAFAAPHPGWPRARFVSPDVMLAARGPEGLDRGDFVAVLGEVHVAFNTVIEPLFMLQHPDPAVLVAAGEQDTEPLVGAVWGKYKTRGDSYSWSARDFDIESGDEPSTRPRDHVLVWRDLELERRDGRLQLRSRTSDHWWDIIEFLDHYLVAESFSAFSPLGSETRRDRIAIDELVINRASWRLVAGAWAWTSVDEPNERFLALRAWAHGLGLPRYVFCKTPEQVKPVFVDLYSPIFAEVLANLLRGASAASFSEMLPATDELWTIDAAGATYTSELRMAIVDPEAWRPDAG